MTVIVTFVDIAGYFDVFATFNITLHVVAFDGATNREEEMEQAPDSDQVFLPFEIVFTKEERVVLDFFDTDVFNTVKPGRAITLAAVVLNPALV